MFIKYFALCAEYGRDYVRLTAIEVNRMGERRLFLIAALWSNADLSGPQWERFEGAFKQIEIRAGERSVTLNRYAGDVSASGISQSPLPLPFPGARHVYYPIERAQLRAIAEASGVDLTALGLSEVSPRYEQREDGSRSLNDFLNQLPGESRG